MPQTDLISFPSTIFFLLVTFFSGYLAFVSFILPDLLFISKARFFLSNNITLTTSQGLVKDRVNVLLNRSRANESKFLSKLSSSSSAAAAAASAITSGQNLNIFLSLEDLLLAVNFLNLVFVLYFVLKDSLYTQQLESSKLLVKPLVDLKESTYKLSEASDFYLNLSKNLRSELSKPLLLQADLWVKNREKLFYKPILSVLNELTFEILNEQHSALTFSKNKALFKQIQSLKQTILC